jgi:hypothetical protein
VRYPPYPSAASGRNLSQRPLTAPSRHDERWHGRQWRRN